MYLIGYDIGSSSIKASLVDAKSGDSIATIQSPESELNIEALHPDWAEQDPEMWWEHVALATQQLLHKTGIDSSEIKGIGIAYQMHGLVLVDDQQQVLRPSIIWCDSRAVEIGNEAFEAIGANQCLSHLLNSPGNFTASKLKWVKENEPEVYKRIHKIMLPGDFVAMRLTGDIVTTASGLSEGIFWDFKEEDISKDVMNHYGFENDLIPTIKPTFSIQGKVNKAAAEKTGLVEGTPVTYRAGDQPNNALALNILNPGEVAATGGTSGVVYGVMGKAAYDPQSRVNGFAHVTHSKQQPSIGVLLCINGAGSQYKWIKDNMVKEGLSYKGMDELAGTTPIGSDGLRMLPFGNGAERMLCNQNPGAHVTNINFNRHTNAHFYRAALEGIAFSFVHGVHILQEMGVNVSVIRVGNDNLFRSRIFAETISTLLNSTIEVVVTTGAIGAAKASGVATGIYPSIQDAMANTKVVMTYEPQGDKAAYERAFQSWEEELKRILKND